MTKKIQVINGKIVLPSSVITGNMEIENGYISYIGAGAQMKNPDLRIDATGKFILPGFIDIHTNGIAGFDLTNGVYNIESGQFVSDEETYLNGLEHALNQYVKTGVTRAILTSLAAPLEQLKKVFGYIKKYKNVSRHNPLNTVLNGLFIEGTFMKLADFRGAHNPEYFNIPSLELFNELHESSGREIKIVNVVPEWGEPAFQLIRYLSSKNIICAAGHSGSTGQQYETAIKNGLCLAVHFLNGPTGSSSKPFNNGGAVETVLRSDSMFVEIIVDGYHVDKAYVLDTIKRKGLSKIVAITDSMFAAELANLREFEVLGVKGKVSINGEYLQIADRENSLFGSKLIMTKAFTNILNWLTTPVEGIWNAMHEPHDFEDALLKASAMCSSNPAKVLGIYDSKDKTGSLEKGKSADIIIADISREENYYRLVVDKVLIKGSIII